MTTEGAKLSAAQDSADRGNGVARFVALAALIAAAVLVAVLMLGSGGGYKVTAVFDDAGQLVVGNQVRVGGRAVGSIDEIILTGEPIVVVPTGDATISLEEGWNFVSTPKQLADGKNTFAVFDTVDTADQSILIYDGLEQKWQIVVSADSFRPLDGIWIYADEACTVPLTFAPGGPDLPPAKNLGRGWNAIGFSDTQPTSAASTLLSLGNHWTTLIGFDAEAQQYDVSIIRSDRDSHSDERTMEPMRGYWVYMTEADTLAAIGA